MLLSLHVFINHKVCSSQLELTGLLCHADERVSSVAVGLYHTVCGTKSGRVYCWGDSSEGQCATLDVTQYTTPNCVASFDTAIRKVYSLELHNTLIFFVAIDVCS